eukprot:1153792-Pleurochrysis_carterae.AAC.1
MKQGRFTASALNNHRSARPNLSVQQFRKGSSAPRVRRVMEIVVELAAEDIRNEPGVHGLTNGVIKRLTMHLRKRDELIDLLGTCAMQLKWPTNAGTIVGIEGFR